MSASSAPSASTGADGQLAIPADANPDERKSYQLANALAACMRGKGFAYVAYVPPKPTGGVDATDFDYAAAKAQISKYGYGAYAPYVYPNDPHVPGRVVDPTRNNPNAATRNALDPAQQAAWDKALQGNGGMAKKSGTPWSPDSCYGKVYPQTYGSGSDPAANLAQAQAAGEKARQDRQNLNGDPQLIALAQTYASCMRGKGITLATTQVTDIRNALRFRLFGEAAQKAQSMGGTIDVATATPLLAEEIREGLDDLDCGQDFRAAYQPKLAQYPDAEGVG